MILTSSATLKWSNAWAMAAFGKACGEGESKPSDLELAR